MYGSLGVSVLGLALTLILIMIIGRIWRARRSPQLREVLRSGLLPTKKFRPVFKRKLVQIEEALPYLMAKEFGAKKFPQGASVPPVQAMYLQARLEQMELQCAQLMQRNTELSRALARAELLRQNMCEIASTAIRSAGLTLKVGGYVPPLATEGRDESVVASTSEHDTSYPALKAKECSSTS